MGKIRVGMAWVLLGMLVFGCAAADSPMGEDFSLSWKQLRAAYESGANVRGSLGMKLSNLAGMEDRAFALLTYVLELSGLEMDLSKYAMGASLMLEGEQVLSVWQMQDEFWRTYGGSFLPELGLSVPRQPDEAQALAYARLRELPVLGALWTHPMARYGMETGDYFPLLDLASRQWRDLQIYMTPYADDGITKSGMGGTDPHAHCTTYNMNGQAIAGALSQWFANMGEDPALRWLFDYAGQSAADRQVYDQWFADMSQRFSLASAPKSLNLRIYLDWGDRVCGVAGSCTIQAGDLRIPVSVTYHKKTSGNKVTYDLNLKAQPNGNADGVSVTLKYITSNNQSGRTARSLTATFSGNYRQLPYKIKLSWDYENLWEEGEGGGYIENITGKGSFELRYDNAVTERLTWSQTQRAFADPKDTSRLAIHDVLAFEGMAASGALESQWSLGSPRVSGSTAGAEPLAHLAPETVEGLNDTLDKAWTALLESVIQSMASGLLASLR